VLRHFKLVGKEFLGCVRGFYRVREEGSSQKVRGKKFIHTTGSSHPRCMKQHHPGNPGLKDMAGSHRHGMESYRTCVEKPAAPPPTLAATAEDPTTLSCMVGRVG
jgi:hypothetical protein